MEVSVQEMTNEILNCIKQYTEEASEKIVEVCKKESETLKENLKRDSTKGKQKQVHTKGGRTAAYPHIKPNEEKAKETVERRIREVLQNG